MAKTVREIMNHEVLSVRADERLETVADAILAFGVTAVPILDADRRPLGVISARDLLRGQDAVAGTPAVVVSSEATVREAAMLMGETGHHELVVVDALGRAVGMLSTLDVLRALVGLAVTHPAEFPHRDLVFGVTWSDDLPLAAERIDDAPESAGVLALVEGGPNVADTVVWAEAAGNVRARLLEMLSLPQEPLLARILGRGDVRFRVARVPDSVRRRQIAHDLAEPLTHQRLPQARALE